MATHLEIDSKALLEKLKSMTDQAYVRTVNQALREGAKVYQDAVIEQAPLKTDDVPGGDSLPPGALKHDVIIRKVQNAPEYQVRFGAETSHVASWVSNGHRIVRGGRSSTSTSGRKRKSKKATGHTVGQVEGSYFFQTAYEASTEIAAEAVQTRLKKLIKDQWSK